MHGADRVETFINRAKVDATYVDCGAQIMSRAPTSPPAWGCFAPVALASPYKGVGSPVAHSYGTCSAIVKVGDVSVEQEFIIVSDESGNYGIFLGLPWLHAMCTTLDLNLEVQLEKTPNTRHSIPMKTYNRPAVKMQGNHCHTIQLPDTLDPIRCGEVWGSWSFVSALPVQTGWPLTVMVGWLRTGPWDCGAASRQEGQGWTSQVQVQIH